MRRGGPTALGGDIFAGLFTKGVQDAGFRVLGHLEHTTYGTATAKLNFPGLDVRNGAENWHEEDFRGKVDFMYCNPPCAAWSQSRLTTGAPWYTHVERLRYITDLVGVGVRMGPQAWACESVTNAWRLGKEFVMGAVAKPWLRAGYHFTVLLQNNCYVGGLQRRPRVFMIAHRKPLAWPPFTDPRTLRDILAAIPAGLPPSGLKVPAISATTKELWRDSKVYGGKFRIALTSKTEDEQARFAPRPRFTTERMKMDVPPKVLLNATEHWHPTKARPIDWHECLAIAGLPFDWKTAEKGLVSASYELSRAVMPGVGRWLAEAVLGGLEKRLIAGAPRLTLADFQDPERPTTEFVAFADDIPDYRFYVPPKAPQDDAPFDGGRPIARKSALIDKVEARGVAKPKVGSGARIRELLQAGRDAESILETIHREFPTSRATRSDVAWNRGKLRKMGVTT